MTIDHFQMITQYPVDNPFHVFNGRSGPLQPCALLKPDVHSEFTGLCFGHEFSSDQRYQQGGASHQCHGQRDNCSLHFHDPAQKASVSLYLYRAKFQLFPVFINKIEQRGNNQHSHNQGGKQRKSHRPGLILKQFTGSSVEIDDGKKNDDRGNGRGRYGSTNLRSSFNGRIAYGHAVLAITKNILHHHDRIVDQHTGAKRQSSQGHNVQGKPVKIHEIKRGHNGHRNGDADDQRSIDPAKEKIQDKHRQKNPVECCFFHSADRFLNKRSLIGDQLQFVSRQRLFDQHHRFGHFLHRLHRVEFGFLIDGKAQTALPVNTDNIFRFGIFKTNFGDFLQEDRSIRRFRIICGGLLVAGNDIFEIRQIC